MKEYKLAKGWAVVMYIFAPMLIILFGFLPLIPLFPSMNKGMSPDIFLLFIPVSLIMISVMVIGLLDTIWGKFVIDTDKIWSKSTLSNRELFFHEIKGYRLNDKYIIIESNTPGKKKIKVSNYFSRTNEIIEWLDSHYYDLDLLDAHREEQEIISDDDFGWTVEQREEKLEKARRTAKILNIAGGLIGAWVLFFPVPYLYAVFASVILPAVLVIIIKRNRGLLRIIDKKGSAYPNVVVAFLFPCLALVFRVLSDFNIFDYKNVWSPVLLLTLFWAAVFFFRNKEFRFEKGADYFIAFFIMLIFACYSYGSLLSVNCLFDSSSSELFQAKVLDKRTGGSKTTSYYLKLTPWGPQTGQQEENVSKSLYEYLNLNDDVRIDLKKGRLNIPWFIISPEIIESDTVLIGH